MVAETINANENAETLSQIDAIVDGMNASRVKRWLHRNVEFPIESVIQGAKAGAVALGFWGGVGGSVVPGAGTLAGTGWGVIGGAIVGGLAGFSSSVVDRKNPMILGLSGTKSYKQWQREQAGQVLKKRERGRIEQVTDATQAAEVEKRAEEYERRQRALGTQPN